MGKGKRGRRYKLQKGKQNIRIFNCCNVRIKNCVMRVTVSSPPLSVGRHFFVSISHMDRVKRIWYLSPMRAAKVQASLRIRAVSPEPSLLAHTSSESRGTFRQKARSLAPLNGWACAVKICNAGMLVTQIRLTGLIWKFLLGMQESWYDQQHRNNTGQVTKHVRYEPPHEETNKMACAPSENSDQPWHLLSLISLCCPHEENLGP